MNKIITGLLVFASLSTFASTKPFFVCDAKDGASKRIVVQQNENTSFSRTAVITVDGTKYYAVKKGALRLDHYPEFIYCISSQKIKDCSYANPMLMKLSYDRAWGVILVNVQSENLGINVNCTNGAVIR